MHLLVNIFSAAPEDWKELLIIVHLLHIVAIHGRRDCRIEHMQLILAGRETLKKVDKEGTGTPQNSTENM